ncbi:ATP-binding cassette domain-containing protein [Thioalkalivibrio sulfidiphilus]|uniref:ABC transporter related n=1 Tax=Thioalkalivibrio sulfidiphilus (strain HL-EbGR7) TaxID=396588 RepID=B8GPX3_THISH|nr:ATP-binding cassette domain-containing protein [Thioalkalivibrio sulfidiphilus]ACL74120.1 ABC transporter related [Thioalkalivibrio sulfidiphilus HL-EbGr7]
MSNPEEGAPLLTVRDLVAGYEAPVCRPVTFELHPGECLGLAGPNGAGKSTLLKAMTAGARRFAGTIWRKPGVAMTFLAQQPERAAECPLTGHDLLRICEARSLPVPGSLQSLLGRRLDTLSGGQHQLLQVWACLGGNASLVLLDEPTNHLDPEALGSLTEILKSRHNGRGLVVVSHDERFLGAVCDRVLEVMPAGVGA